MTIFALRYSIVCSKAGCNTQFESLLDELMEKDTVLCPACSTTIDIRDSKTNGDLAQIFREARSLRSRTER
jgi:hypothetical protein